MNWWNLGVLFAACAGWAKLLACGLNRIQTLPWSHATLARVRGVHDLFLMGYPVWVFLGLVRGGPELLTGGSWADLNGLEMGLLLAGSGGFGLLLHGIWETWSYRLPDFVNCSGLARLHFPDSAQKSRKTFGPAWPLLWIPWNEQHNLVISSYEATMNDLPAEFGPLKIVHLSDLHFRGAVDRSYFEHVCEQAAALKPDMFVFTGDLLDQQALADWIPATLGELRAPLGCYFVLGNHDWYLNPAETRAHLCEYGWIDVAERTVNLRNPRSDDTQSMVQISGTEFPWMGSNSILEANSLENSNESPFRILLSHSPDCWPQAREQQFHLMFAGHTHGGQVRLPILGPVYAPSRFGCRYSAGVFWRDPLLFLVSQGISGRDPVRWNCCPELIQLTITSSKSLGEIPRRS